MKRISTVLLVVIGVAIASIGSRTEAEPRVRLRTSAGDIVIRLFPDRSPLTVQNFLAYVRDGYYDGTIFHRVIDGFMIQGGGLDANMQEKRSQPPIRNESDNGESNRRGAVSMARTNDPHSATSQFFINLVVNDFLDYGAQDAGQWGYTVFGEVASGMEIVDRIGGVPTTTVGAYRDVPEVPIVIERATIEESEESEDAD
jgi:cyclophilin family peptidyl-prolyl cis-trans isomerase